MKKENSALVEEDFINYYAITSNKSNSLEEILEGLLSYVRHMTHSDAGTIYLKEGNRLKFHVYQNATLSSQSNTLLNEKFKTFNLDISPTSHLLAVRSLVESRLIVIDDIYASNEEHFEGTKKIDAEVGYQSHSFLTIPLVHDETGEAVGVLQLINKKIDNKFSSYTVEDREQIIHLSNFATILILHTYDYISKLAQMNKNLNDTISKEMKKNELHNEQMSSTLQELNSYLKPSQATKEFSIQGVVENVLRMLKDDLLNSHITISKEFEDKISLVGIENEFEHLVLNIINYIKDSFLINNIEKRHINIKLFYKKDAVILEISNSAGNIDNDIINKLFDIDSGVHSGIDLYMSQEIAQKHNGVLRVKNIKNGSLFHFETL